mgnify:CR=1 FL=1
MGLRSKWLVLIAFGFLVQTVFSQSQTERPITWSVEQLATEQGTEIQIIGDIDEGWYVYSMFLDGDGPTPTEVVFEDIEGYRLIGETTETATKEEEGFDKTFGMDVKKLKGEATFSQQIKFSGEEKPIVRGYVLYQICDDEKCLRPVEEEFAIITETSEAAIGELAVAALLGTGLPNIDNQPAMFSIEVSEEPVNDCINAAAAQNSGENSSYWGIFLLGIFGGLIAILTPCVFPMIPLTVTFFTKRHDNKAKGRFEAVLYGFSIFLIYFLLAVPFLIFQVPQDTLYRISTSPILNLAFFAIFIFFALSLFGYFELTLPSKWANQSDAASNKGGLVGIFFMAITLAIVSFSCTGPILGSLMAGTIASEGGQTKLVAGMSGFGVALGLPFALFAMFPGLLKKLPKSGSWMNTVKVVLAFVEVALAMKFLSNADLVSRWGLISYNTFLILWILISLALAAYLFGFIRFPHDSKNQSVSIPRKAFGALSVGLAIFFMTGLAGNSMGFLSGFFPPKDHGVITELDEGIALAKIEDKPILLDFTGWSCVNCRQVEQNIWPNPEVAKRLNEQVVLVSLYADDRTKLPENRTYFSENLSRTVKTVGGKWTDFEAKEFGQIAQPLYALITPDGQLLNSPIAFTTSVQDYIDFLDCGIGTYETLRIEGKL